MARMFLIPVYVALVFLEVGVLRYFNDFLAVSVFGIAAFTDFLDGKLARKWNMVTDFGKLFDSAADKLLCGSALVLLVYVFSVVSLPPFGEGASVFIIILTVFVVLIICRELFMTAFRSVAASRNIIIAADMPGKIKAAAQMFGIVVIMIAPDLMQIGAAHALPGLVTAAQVLLPGLVTAAQVLFIVGFALLATGALMAVVSCVLYIVKYPGVLSEKAPEKADAHTDENGDGADGE